MELAGFYNCTLNRSRSLPWVLRLFPYMPLDVLGPCTSALYCHHSVSLLMAKDVAGNGPTTINWASY